MTAAVIGYCGMTHLGICSAFAASERGFSVVCYDSDSRLSKSLSQGNLPVIEPGLDELLSNSGGRLTFTSDEGKLAACDLVYVASDVPTDDNGQSDLSSITSLTERIGEVIGKDVVMVILSQVPPGFTRGLGRDPATLFCQVETLVIGRAVERALNPERFIIGCADPSQLFPNSLASFLDAFGCPVLPMRYESAELAKIAINCCLVASVSVANTLAELCEHIGADWSEITPALRSDERIGEHAYLKAGLGIAGGNLERDLATVCRLSETHGTDAGVVSAWIENSRHRKNWVMGVLRDEVFSETPEAVIALLGLTYKENTNSTKNSPALALLGNLAPYGVRAYDPVVIPDPDWHPNLFVADSPLAACEGADALSIMTPWAEFRDMKPEAIREALRGHIVIDPFAVLDGDACRKVGLRWLTLGAPGKIHHHKGK